MSGISYDGDGTVNITGQAISGDSDEAEAGRGGLLAWRSMREQIRQAAASGDAEENSEVRNTGSGSVNITNSTVSGRFIRSARITGR